MPRGADRAGPDLTLGDQVRRARLAAGLTQAHLARQSGVPVGTVRDLEQGRTRAPRAASVAAVRRALALDADRHSVSGTGGPFRIDVLGPLRCRIGAEEVTPRGRLQAIMLAVAAVHAGELVSDDVFADAMWPHGAPRAVAAALQTHAARIRNLLATGRNAPTLARERGGYRLLAPTGSVDATEFASRVRAAEATVEPAARARALVDALGLWRGAVVADLPDLAGSDAVSTWERRRRYAAATLADVGTACDTATATAALDAALVVLELQPLDEHLAGRVILLLVHLGRSADALRVFADTRRALAEELGADPGPALRDAHRAALRDDPDEEPAAPAAPTGRRTVHSELPRDTPDFVGRVEEIAAARRELLRDDGLPGLVAVVGMGGIGKTTLATRVAHQVRDHFPDGQFHLDLRGADEHPVSTAQAVDLLLRRLEVVTNPADDAASRAALLRTALARGRYLLVLDNVVDAEQVRALVPGSRGSGVVITSRRSLAALDGVLQIAMPTLPPHVAQAFVRHRVDPGPDGAVDERTVAAIAEACGHLPLALRIAVDHAAAARADLATLHASLADTSNRLRALRHGDRAVRASLAVGWSALDADLRRTLGDLASLPGADVHFDAAVAAAGLPDGERLVALSELSLLEIRAGRRIGMHDLVREMVRESEPRGLAGDAPPVRRAIAWYSTSAPAALAARHPFRPLPIIRPTRPSDVHAEGATAWLDQEHATLLALCDAMLAGLAPYDWRLLFTVAYSCEDREESSRAIDLLGRGLSRPHAHDPQETAYLELALGRAYARSSRFDDALAPLERCRAAAAVSELPGVGAWSHELTALAYELGGDQTSAGLHYETALRLCEDEPVPGLGWSILGNLADMELNRGRLVEAKALFERALAANLAIGHRRGIAIYHQNLATVAWYEADPARALELVGLSVNELLDVGEVRSACEALVIRTHAAVDLDLSEIAASSATSALGLAVRLEDAALFARALAAVSVVEAQWHDVARGVDGLVHAAGVAHAAQASMAEVEVRLAFGVQTLRAARPELVEQAATEALDVARRIGNEHATAQAVALIDAVRGATGHRVPVALP